MREVDVIIPCSCDLDPFRLRALNATIKDVARFQPSRVIVVEASLGGVAKLTTGDCVEHVVLDMKWNKARVVNMAVRDVCDKEWFMMLDGDLLLHGGLRTSFERNADMYGAMMPFDRAIRLDKEDTEDVLAGRGYREDKERRCVGVLGGGGLLMLRDSFLSIRGFDERFPWMEDSDFSNKVRKTRAARTTKHRFPALHLWHPPADYPKDQCKAMFQKRKKLNADAMVADTVSCIEAEHE